MSSEENTMLTDSAKRALDNYLALERQKIIERAQTVAANRANGRGIDSVDIIAALTNEQEDLEEIRWQEMHEYSRRRRARVLQIANLYGLILILTGTLVAIYFQFRDSIQPGTAFGLAIAAAGAIIYVAFSRFAPLTERVSLQGPSFNRERGRQLSAREKAQDGSAQLRGEYLETWNELERVVRVLAQEDAHAAPARRAVSLRELVGDLAERGILTEQDMEVFFEALRLRNRLVHDLDNAVSSETILAGVADMEHLKYHLEGLL